MVRTKALSISLGGTLITLTLLGLWSIGSMFFGSMAHAQGNSQSIFDDLIQRYGAIKKGKVNYASFSNRFNQKLNLAVREFYKKETYYDAMLSSKSNMTYSYVEADINNDGRKDAFIQLNNSFGAGSGGVHTSIFMATDNGYEYIGGFAHQVTLVILPTKSFGFQDILVVPGKIFSRNNPNVFYSKCSFSPQKRYQSTNCQNIQRGSVVSGTVIETPTFRRNPPEFSFL